MRMHFSLSLSLSLPSPRLSVRALTHTQIGLPCRCVRCILNKKVGALEGGGGVAVEDVEELNKNEIIQKNTNTHPFFSLTRRRIRWIHNIDARFNLSYPELTSVSLALSVLLFLRGSSGLQKNVGNQQPDEWSSGVGCLRCPSACAWAWGFALHGGCLPCMHAKEESWNVLPLRQAQRCAGGMNSRLSSPSSSASAGSKSLACSTERGNFRTSTTTVGLPIDRVARF